jgi:kynureninase
LIERAKVIPDFRAPDSLRFGFSPLYTSFVDVHTAAHRLRTLVENEVHHEYAGVKATVT